jgi:hypothetical protein
MDGLANTFLGEIDLVAADIEGAYRSPLDAFLLTYASSFNDGVINVNDSVFPFPAGLPIVQESEMYCMELSAGQHQKVELTDAAGQVYYSFEDTTKVFGPSYKFAVANTLNVGQNSSTLNLDSASVGYSFITNPARTTRMESAYPPATSTSTSSRTELSWTIGTPSNI